MATDIQKSLLTYIYDLLTTDASLMSAMGGSVRLYLTWATPDAELPYLVQRLDMGILADWSPVARCTYLLDIWSDSSNAEEILAIRALLMGLLDGLDFSTDETSECYLWIQTDGFIPEPEPGIWHYTCQFNLKWVNDSKIGVTLKR